MQHNDSGALVFSLCNHLQMELVAKDIWVESGIFKCFDWKYISPSTVVPVLEKEISQASASMEQAEQQVFAKTEPRHAEGKIRAKKSDSIQATEKNLAV